MTTPRQKPTIGITMGDVNGIGPQIILKTLQDEQIYKFCNVLIFGSESVVHFYKKTFHDLKTRIHVIHKQDDNRLNPKIANLLECAEKPFDVTMGESTEESGTLSLRFINDAIFFLQQGKIDALVTAPVNKAFIKTNPPFSGHTNYLAQKLGTEDPLMVMTDDAIRVALVTQHVPLQDVSKYLTIQSVLNSIQTFNKSLVMDFGVYRPKIAVLALNPHSGENGKIGHEEQDVIIPAIQKAQNESIIVQGPFPSDAFFGGAKFPNFDGVLAMYHDQGLIPFKYIAGLHGINFTANLPYVRTSPDHGVALDIVATGLADCTSMRSAIFGALDIYKTRMEQEEIYKNALKEINIKQFKERN